MLVLAGAYDFAQNQTLKPPSRKRLEFMARAYDLLRPDLVFATPFERSLLAKAGVQPRATWHGSEHLEQHVLHPAGGPKVGVILLPPLPETTAGLPPALVKEIEHAVHALRASVKIVVAMSPWGFGLEQELLKSPGLLPDVLLGSGPGIGMAGSVSASGKTLWVRSFTQGKSVSRIDILAWPEHNSKFKWTEEQNVRMILYGLTEQYQEDPQMLMLMQSLGAD